MFHLNFQVFSYHGCDLTFKLFILLAEEFIFKGHLFSLENCDEDDFRKFVETFIVCNQFEGAQAPFETAEFVQGLTVSYQRLLMMTILLVF